MTRYAAVLVPIALAGCHASPASENVPGDAGDTRPFTEIGVGDTVNFTGTEPFWGGRVSGAALTYSTPEDPEGTDIEVSRFAGRGGVSWSGTLNGARFALAVTPGACSDGMSDRSYPLVATLQVGGEQRNGCAWIGSGVTVDPQDRK